jgi:nitrate reductase gamma subunit
MSTSLNTFLFSVYPYVCLTVFLLGSLARFERAQYTWKSDSSQLLRRAQLRWGSNLFHIGVLFLLFGHTVGLLTPHALYSMFITASQKQMLAIVSGGAAGTLCFIGLTMLLHRRMFDARIRKTSRRTDLALLIVLWAQLCLGLLTLPFSYAQRADAHEMLVLADWAQRIVTLRPDAAEMTAVLWPFKLHLVLGMTVFLLFPFTRLVHIWSGFGTLGYALRPYQLVRSRRFGASAGRHGGRRGI